MDLQMASIDEFTIMVSTGCDDILLSKLPEILKSRKAILRFCSLTEKCCPALAGVLSTRPSCLRELDLGYNSIRDKGVASLIVGLVSQDCRLKTLRLHGCGLTDRSCASLTLVLKDSPKLKVLDLSGNEIGDDGIRHIANGLGYPSCHLDTLKISYCSVGPVGCRDLGMVLHANPGHLKHLDISVNPIGDEGAIALFTGVDMSTLKTLEMYECNLTQISCGYICNALQSETSILVELNLSNNNLMDSGLELICQGMRVWGRLEKLNIARCGITEVGCGHLAVVLCCVIYQLYEGSRLSSTWQAVELTHLNLSRNTLGDEGVRRLANGFKSPCTRLKSLNLSQTALSDKACAALASGIVSEVAVISELDLSSNGFQDSGVQRLCVGLRNSRCKLEKLSMRNCGLTAKSLQYLASALKSNPAHMAEFHLMGNRLEGSSALKVLAGLIKSQSYSLHTIDIVAE